MESIETNETTAMEQSSNVNEEVQQVEQNAEATATATPLMLTTEEVVARAKQLAEKPEEATRQELDLLKQLFYKYHNAAVQAAIQAHIEAGGTPETFTPVVDPMEPEFRALMQQIREYRAKQQQEAERLKQEGLQRKLAILERIKELTSTPDEAHAAFDEFKQLQTEWKEIKQVPAERATELWKNYQLYVEQFYDLLKQAHELRDYDFKKNLEIKTRLCEQAEALTTAEEVVPAFNQLQALHQEWKETGPVSKELREEIWERFKAASTIVNKRHQDYFEAIKAREEENLAKKTALCERIEAIDTDVLSNFAAWDEVTKQIIEMQAEWKTIGFAPQKVNQQIFERFRMACDQFFQLKGQFFQDLKDTLNENLAKKKELVEKAEALKDSTEWRKTSDALIALQKQWKEIGAVPRKYSDQLWQQFTAACDQFFAAKQAATADTRQEQQANMEQKQSIIAQLQELAEQEGQQIISKVKELQAQWNEVGHVPFREKDRLFKEYRAICDKIYEAYGASQAKQRLNKFRNGLAQKVEKAGTTIEVERARMQRAYERMRDELNTYENNLGFLNAGSKKGNSMVDLLKKKADKLRDELNLLSEKIKAVDEQLKK